MNTSHGNGSAFQSLNSSPPAPEYDDPANLAPEEDQYSSQYGGYGAPYDQFGSRNSMGRRSYGSIRNLNYGNGNSSSPEPPPPPPPPRNHEGSFNDSKDSNELSEAECDRDQLLNNHRNYGGEFF